MSDNNPNATSDNSNGADPKAGGKMLRKVLKYAVIADIIWALLLATFQAVVFAEAGNALGASGLGTTLGTVLAWVITFVIGLFQGAVFMIVAAGFVFVITMFVVMLKSKADKKDGGTNGDGTNKMIGD